MLFFCVVMRPFSYQKTTSVRYVGCMIVHVPGIHDTILQLHMKFNKPTVKLFQISSDDAPTTYNINEKIIHKNV